MINNEYFLTYRYTKASVEILVTSGETELYRLDLCKAVKLSLGKPWKTDNIEFDMVDVADENGNLTVFMENNVLMVTVSVSLADNGLLSCGIEWKNTSNETLKDVSLGFTFPVKTSEIDKVFIPSVCYESSLNEQGEFKNPLFQNGGYVVEEHRLSFPAVAVERQKRLGGSVALFSIPSQNEYNKDFDNEWSVGILKEDDCVELSVFSGNVMYMGKKDTISSGKTTVDTYERGYFDMPGGAEIEKKIYLIDWDTQKEESGIAKLVGIAESLYSPKNIKTSGMYAYVKNKSVALQNRFIQNEEIAGYVRKLTANTDDDALQYNEISEAWTTVNLSAAWCDAVNSLQCMRRDGIMRAKQCVDFYIKSSHCKKKGLRYLYLDTATMKWSFSSKGDIVPSAEYGMMVYNLCEIIQLFKDHSLDLPESWEDALFEACDFLCGKKRLTKEGRFPEFWNPDGSVGISEESPLSVICVAALARAYFITGEQKYGNTARKVLEKYYDILVSRHKILQTKNEKSKNDDAHECDKLSDIYFVMAALECYEASQHDERYARMARTISLRLVSYVCFLNYPLRKDSKAARAEINPVGLSVASNGSNCLDLIFPSYELKRISELTGDMMLGRFADISLSAMLRVVSAEKKEYGFSAVGEHPEQFFYTNWSLSGEQECFRGGYSGFNSLSSVTWTFRQALKTSTTSFYNT